MFSTSSSDHGGAITPPRQFNVNVWLWHAPPLYDATLVNQTLHILEHISFVLFSLLYWWPMFSPVKEGLPRLSTGGQVLYLFFGSMPMVLLGAGLTFAPPLYAPYLYAPRVWGLSPATDQQLGGLLMWVPVSNVKRNARKIEECSVLNIHEWIDLLDQLYDQYGYVLVFLGSLGENTALLCRAQCWHHPDELPSFPALRGDSSIALEHTLLFRGLFHRHASRACTTDIRASRLGNPRHPYPALPRLALLQTQEEVSVEITPPADWCSTPLSRFTS